MTAVAIALTALLGTGGLGGLAVLLRARADRGATVVDTVSKGVLVMERVNSQLEKSNAWLEAELTAERALTTSLRGQLDAAQRQLERCRRDHHHPEESP